MATGGLYGSAVTGPVSVSSGAETSGLYGNNTNFGGTYFEYFVFIESTTVPATPTGGSWNFTTNVGTPPSGWSNSPPANPTNPVYLSIALVNSRSNALVHKAHKATPALRLRLPLEPLQLALLVLLPA